MSTLKELNTKNAISSRPETLKIVEKAPEQQENVISVAKLTTSKVVQKQRSSQDTKQQSAQRIENGSDLRIDVSLNVIEDNTSDLIVSRLTEMKKSNKSQQRNVKFSNNEQNQLSKSGISNFSQFACQDQQLQNYFSQFDSSTYQENPIHGHQLEMFTTLKSQLTNGKLLIEQKKPFPLIKKEKKSINVEEREMKQRLEAKRQEALMKIRQIEEQELMMKRKAISIMEKPRKNGGQEISKIEQSVDKQQVKKTLKEYKKFTLQMQKRQQQVQIQRQQQHKLQVQKQQQFLQLRRQSRRQEVKHNMQQIMQKQRVRKSILSEWKAKQMEVKNKKYLYIESKEKERRQEEIKEMQHQQMLDRIKKNHQLDMEDIEKHQRKYEELLEERREVFKSLATSAITHSSSSKRYKYSKFHQFVVRQMEEHKKQELQKIMKVKENQHKDKIHQYQQKIDSQIKPNLHYKKFVPIPRAMSLEALEPKDRWNLGLAYLKKAKKLKMPQNQLKLFLTKKQESDRLKLSRQTKDYKDYLQQIKKDIKYDPTQRKIGEILKNKRSYSNYESLKDAKYMSEYLVAKSKNSEQQKTMLAIKTKMDILNAMY